MTIHNIALSSLLISPAMIGWGNYMKIDGFWISGLIYLAITAIYFVREIEKR